LWAELINRLLEKVVEIEAPEDAGPEGQFKSHLEDFCNEGFAATRDDITVGKVWWDDESKACLFRFKDLSAFLMARRFTMMTDPQIWSVVRKIGGSATQIKLMGHTVRVWSVPQPYRIKHKLEIVRTDNDVKF
jgi:hypothetical protein